MKIKMACVYACTWTVAEMSTVWLPNENFKGTT